MASLQVTVTATAAVLFLFLLRHVIVIRKYPSAPGPRLALLSRHWYAWEVWKGKFEVWNLAQHRIHGKIIRVAPNMYTIDDLDGMKTIYGVASNMPKSDWYAVWSTSGVTGDNLFSMEDRKLHGQMRRKVANMYSMSTIKHYEPYVDKCSRILMRQFEKLEAAGDTFDLQRWMQSYAFDVIGEITFSSNVGFMEAGAHDIDDIMKLLDSLNSFCTIIGIDRFLFPLLYAKYRIPSAGLVSWVEKLSQLRSQSIGQQGQGTIQDFQSKVEAVGAKDPEAISVYKVDNTLAQNVAAGSDTTSITVTAILFHLVKTPAVMKTLRREIMTAIADGKVSSPITLDESQRLPYLLNVIKEGMRLHPAVGLPLWRVVQEPGVTMANRFFPAGTIVGINPWVAHYNTQVYGTDVNEFKPERWDPSVTPPEQLAQMERYYMPFGSGTRTCIGKNISMLEIAKLIPELLRRYEIELISQEMKTKTHWFVKQHDVLVRIRKIESS